MTFRELAEQITALPANERLELINIIVRSLKQDSRCESWSYLEPRVESWRKQLYIKDRKLPASVVWSSMLTESMTPEETADNWDLPIEAVHEAIRYCETHKELLTQEAEAERSSIEGRGISLEPTLANR